MNLVEIARLIFLISSSTREILASVRPRRMSSFGFAEAREMAVSAPMLPVLGPVMMTGGGF